MSEVMAKDKWKGYALPSETLKLLNLRGRESTQACESRHREGGRKGKHRVEMVRAKALTGSGEELSALRFLASCLAQVGTPH